MSRRLEKALIVFNRKKEESAHITDLLEAELSRRGILTLIAPESAEGVAEICEECLSGKRPDIIFAVGGDGTFLYTARNFAVLGAPIAGINSGRLGFLMEISPDEFSKALDKIENGTAKFRKRFLLDIEVRRSGKTYARYSAMNDAVISRGEISRMVEIGVAVHDPCDPDESPEGYFLSNYRADGVILSTPVGSTAYNLSAGGPILMPDSDALVITPVSPHTLGVRPVLVGCNRIVEIFITKSTDNALLTLDGQVNQAITTQDRIFIRRSETEITLYYEGDEAFFMTLREKLGWHL